MMITSSEYKTPNEKLYQNIQKIYDAYFKPENTSFTHLENDLLETFVSAGHDIFIVCPTPTRGIDKETAKKYSISGIPCLLVFNKGQAVERMVGLMPKSTIINNIEKHI